MNDFPAIKVTSYIKTRGQFHSIAKIIGKIRETIVTPIAKNDNLWLNIVDKGFAMPPIESLKNLEIGCNIETMKIEVCDSGMNNSFDIKGKSLSDIANNLMINLNSAGVEKPIDFMALTLSGAVEISDKDSSDFLTQLYNFHWLIKEFHSRIREDVKTQVCLWPHHFDNAFIWYSGKKVNEQFANGEEQMGIGVSNGDEMYPLPYIYMTFWPPLRTTNKLQIIDGAILHDSAWTGLILPYEAIQAKQGIDEQKKLIEDFFNTSFSSIKMGFSKR